MQLTVPQSVLRKAASMVTKHAKHRNNGASKGRSGARQPETVLPQPLVDDNWRLMAPIIAVATLVTAVSTGTFPGKASLALLLAAIWLVSAMPRVNRRELHRRPDERRRIVFQALHVAFPMLLFGLAIGIWSNRIAVVNWRETISAPVVVSIFAAVILNRRIASIIAATLSAWLGVAVIAGNFDTLLILTGGGIIGGYAAIQQIRNDRAEVEAERERRRSQMRAEQLLNEFEESGQGWFFETDRRGSLVYVSPIVGKVLERRSQDLVGRAFTKLFQPDAEEGQRTLAFHLSTRSAFNELALRAAVPGEERWWSISGRPLYDDFGNFLGFRGSGHDLTEKRRSQQHASRPESH